MGTIPYGMYKDVSREVWHSGHVSFETICLFFRRSICRETIMTRNSKEGVDFANGGDFPKPFPVRIHGG